VFYALQPFLLKLYGNEKAYGIAGLVAATAASAQIAGGFLAPQIRKLFKKRTSALLTGISVTSFVLILVSVVNSFWLALVLIFLWGLMFAAVQPIRQAYLNGIIPSEQRATVLSFDSLMGSSGGIVIQPALGKVADMWNYSTSYMVAAFFQAGALPFIYLARRERAKSDIIQEEKAATVPTPPGLEAVK
jgi:MFS family permease